MIEHDLGASTLPDGVRMRHRTVRVNDPTGHDVTAVFYGLEANLLHAASAIDAAVRGLRFSPR